MNAQMHCSPLQLMDHLSHGHELACVLFANNYTIIYMNPAIPSTLARIQYSLRNLVHFVCVQCIAANASPNMHSVKFPLRKQCPLGARKRKTIITLKFGFFFENYTVYS